jgi:hypothetical protein
MTMSIDRATRGKGAMPPGTHPDPKGPRRLIIGVRFFAGIAAAAGVGFTAFDVAGGVHVHLVAPAVVSLVFAGQASIVLIVHYLLADRCEFYRRGHLDGWVKCYRGQEPDTDDPLIH